VVLADGRRLAAPLLVGADSRFSFVREQLGIPAQINRTGRSMLCCRVHHEADHDSIATEWFDHGETKAILPLNGRMASAVLTLASEEIDRLCAMDPATLGAELTRRFDGRLGQMRVAQAPHAYPLATTWSRHFASTSAALIGDAAVGMHPVTAHGFNLGLRSAASLAALVVRAHGLGRPLASPLLLRRYEAGQRLAARPLYDGTNLLVNLFTAETPPARLARSASLRLAARLPGLRGGSAACSCNARKHLRAENTCRPGINPAQPHVLERAAIEHRAHVGGQMGFGKRVERDMGGPLRLDHGGVFLEDLPVEVVDALHRLVGVEIAGNRHEQPRLARRNRRGRVEDHQPVLPRKMNLQRGGKRCMAAEMAQPAEAGRRLVDPLGIVGHRAPVFGLEPVFGARGAIVGHMGVVGVGKALGMDEGKVGDIEEPSICRPAEPWMSIHGQTICWNPASSQCGMSMIAPGAGSAFSGSRQVQTRP
jgi:hypothetical protein